MRFCAELARTGCVKDACAAVGLTTTSAYRAYKRCSEFAAKWDEALESERPILMQAAFERAVNGVEVTYRQGRRTVTVRRYSDALLRFLIERGDGKKNARAQRWIKPADPEKTRQEILRKVAAVRAQRDRERREEALAFAERMRAEGWAP
ncbi:hypothetical protein CKY28_14120 [Sphingomonas lenta]|uniref:Uncharacterized protein n=1 Tax=Sphingomonas lenta TaxID=1141887 RepID=A0A2A2SD97_9SPHN|nr:hypothetical protein CKY28_14120 [Sphingomonas lenta]